MVMVKTRRLMESIIRSIMIRSYRFTVYGSGLVKHSSERSEIGDQRLTRGDRRKREHEIEEAGSW